ncbi:MAG: LamG-like jellyroll fold domain-containing protein, partial [Candidatus Omnitrophota bacterium]
DSDTINVASTVTLTNLDTFTTTGSTFIFDGTTTLTSAGLAFNTVQIGTGAVGASVTTADNMDINGALTVLNGGATTFNISDDTVSAASTVTLTNLDTFTVTNSTFVFDGTTSLTSDTLAFNNIQIGSATAGGSLTPADNMDINGNVTVQNGGATTWNITNRRINIAGSVNLTNLDTLTVTGSIVIMDGTGAANVTSAGLAFNHFMINDGMVGYWRMDEANDNDTVIDYSGYGYNGTANSFAAGGGPVTNVSSAINFTNLRSLDFDGTDDYVQTTSNDLQTLNDFTIALWFRADATNFAGMLLWQGDVAGNGYGAQQEMSISLGNINGGSLGNLLAFNLGNTDNDINANILMVDTAFTDTTNWHHVAVTVSNMSTAPAAELFLDGVSVDTDTGTTAVTPRTNWNTNLRFGRPGAATRFYDGLLDEVRVYNRVLNDPEILLLAQGTHPATFLGTNTLQDNLDVNGTLSINAGALDAGSDRSITVAGSWMNNGGVFTEQQGIVTMDGISGTSYVLSGSQTFYNFRVIDGNGGGDLTVQLLQDLDADGTLTLTDGDLNVTAANYRIRMAGNWFNNGGTFTPHTGTVVFEGTGADQTITSNAQIFYNIHFNNTALSGNDDIILADNLDINGTMTLIDGDLDANTNDVTINVRGNWLASTPGTFDEGLSTVIFDAPSGSAVITMPDDTFYNVNINSAAPGTATFVVQGTLDVNGTFMVDAGTFDLATNNPPMFVEGNFILNSGAFNPGTSTIAFDGDKIFFDGIITNVGTILIDPTTTLTSDMVCTTIQIDPGDTLVTDGYEIDCSTNMRVDGTLNAESGTDGNSTINIGRHWRSHNGLLMMDGSTVIMDDNNGTDDLRPGNSNSFYNLILDDSNGGGDTTWVLLSDLHVDGTLQILDGTLDANIAQNRPIFVGKDWVTDVANGVFIPQTATVTFNGISDQTITGNGISFYDVIVSNSSGMPAMFIGSMTFNSFISTVGNTALTFEEGEIYTINDTLNLNGQGVGSRIVINSQNGISRFTFDVLGGNQIVSFVEVSNSQASSHDIRAKQSLNNGNTDTLEASPRWIFGPLRGAVLNID